MSNFQYALNERKELEEFLPITYQRVLEVGCGYGGFKNTLKNGIEIWGIEPNVFAAKQAEANGYKVLIGIYDSVEAMCPDGYFNLIICNDVIEHMSDPEGFLLNVKSKMAPNATIIGSIPNVRHFPVLVDYVFNKDWQYTQDGVLDKTHLKFFTEKSLLRLFNDCHYSVESFKGINKDQFVFSLKKLLKY